MKTIYLALLVSLSALGTYAQSPAMAVGSTDTSNLEVVKKGWRFEVRNPALDESPFVSINDRLQEEQDIRETATENARRAKLGMRPVKRVERPPTERMDGPATSAYVYEVKLKNNSEKQIQSLGLAYVFYEIGTERELGRRQFSSKEGISPGKTKSLTFRSSAPPTGTINANDAGKKQKYNEQIIIESIKYTDGSMWQATAAAVKKP